MARILDGNYKVLERFGVFLDYPVSENEVFFEKINEDPLPDEMRDLFSTVRAIVWGAYAEMNGCVLKLALKRYVVPRVRIQLFLERIVLRPESEHSQLLSEYKGGIKALERDMNRLHMPSVSKYVQRRLGEIQSLREKWKKSAPIDSSENEGSTPFNESDSPACMSRENDESTSLVSHPTISRWYQNVSQPLSSEYKTKFGDGKNTGVLGIVSAETLENVDELSDWRDILKS